MAGRAAVLFDVGGAIDMEFAWEMAVDGAIAAALVRRDPAIARAARDAARVLLQSGGITIN